MKTPRGERVLRVAADTETGRRVFAALASEPRLRILELLCDHVANVSEIAEALGISMSSATMHIASLEEAGLVSSEQRPAARGTQKLCARTYDTLLVSLSHGRDENPASIEISMPVGAYVDCQVSPTCGLAGRQSVIGLFDDPSSFYEPGRIDAQLLWFRQGYVEYRFPNRIPQDAELESLSLSMELSSEAPLHCDTWPSDITLWLNKVEVGTWTSPGDFGGERGSLTPSWWESRNSQYGVMKVWQVNREATFIDGIRISDITIEQIDASGHDFISVRVGVQPDAKHVGGLNLFGRSFGNYPQDLVLSLRYR